MYTLYGISNCSTVKKAKDWLTANNIEYQFHDYRKQGVTLDLLNDFDSRIGWEAFLNKRSASWPQLPDEQRESISKQTALDYMQASPTLIKRPLLDTEEQIIIGFTADNYQQAL
jgi:Spx/MgsR family transcriptional regulator